MALTKARVLKHDFPVHGNLSSENENFAFAIASEFIRSANLQHCF